MFLYLPAGATEGIKHSACPHGYCIIMCICLSVCESFVHLRVS